MHAAGHSALATPVVIPETHDAPACEDRLGRVVVRGGAGDGLLSRVLSDGVPSAL